MQILTRYGFFTVSCVGFNNQVDSENLIIKSRSAEELNVLRTAFPKLGYFTVNKCCKPGFAAQMRIPKSIWNSVCEGIILDLDYAGDTPGQASLFNQLEQLKPVPKTRLRRKRKTPVTAPDVQTRLWAA